MLLGRMRTSVKCIRQHSEERPVTKGTYLGRCTPSACDTIITGASEDSGSTNGFSLGILEN